MKIQIKELILKDGYKMYEAIYSNGFFGKHGYIASGDLDWVNERIDKFINERNPKVEIVKTIILNKEK